MRRRQAIAAQQAPCEPVSAARVKMPAILAMLACLLHALRSDCGGHVEAYRVPLCCSVPRRTLIREPGLVTSWPQTMPRHLVPHEKYGAAPPTPCVVHGVAVLRSPLCVEGRLSGRMPRRCSLALLALACLQRAAAYTDPQEGA